MSCRTVMLDSCCLAMMLKLAMICKPIPFKQSKFDMIFFPTTLVARNPLAGSSNLSTEFRGSLFCVIYVHIGYRFEYQPVLKNF